MNKIGLTELECTILSLLAQGFTRKHIAQKLKIPYAKCLKIVKDLIFRFESKTLAQCIIKAYLEGFIEI